MEGCLPSLLVSLQDLYWLGGLRWAFPAAGAGLGGGQSSGGVWPAHVLQGEGSPTPSLPVQRCRLVPCESSVERSPRINRSGEIRLWNGLQSVMVIRNARNTILLRMGLARVWDFSVASCAGEEGCSLSHSLSRIGFVGMNGQSTRHGRCPAVLEAGLS